MADVTLVGIALIGVIAGSIVALVPGLHVYNLAAILIMLISRHYLNIPGECLVMLLVGLVTGWSMLNVIPAVFLSAPDDASAFIVNPATKLLLRGRGFQATAWIGAGSLGALACIVITAPVLGDILRPLRIIMQPHLGWMLLAICGFLILSEWPREDSVHHTRIKRLMNGWIWLGAGLLTFGLSGLLGFILFMRSPLAADNAIFNLLPAFTGLFTVPGLLLSLSGRSAKQRLALQKEQPADIDLCAMHLIRGTLTGFCGGLFASFLPVISAGIGGLLAGHASAQYDERTFMVSQGATKTTYYVGSLVLLCMPGLSIVRGGSAWLISTVYIPVGWHLYGLVIAAIALGGTLAYGLLQMGSAISVRLVRRINTRFLAAGALVLVSCMTLGFTGITGISIVIVASFIGLIPVLIGGRRMNCLGLLLVPMTLNLNGFAPLVAHWLGLA